MFWFGFAKAAGLPKGDVQKLQKKSDDDKLLTLLLMLVKQQGLTKQRIYDILKAMAHDFSTKFEDYL